MNLGSWLQNSLMSGIWKRTIANLSIPIPHAQPMYSVGSRSASSRTLSCKIPEVIILNDVYLNNNK